MSAARPQDICNCAALCRAALIVARRYEAALKPSGLDLEDFIVLAKLDRLGAKTISDLADILGMEPAAMAYKLKGMVARGLVTSRPTHRDRRCRVIAPAPAGLDMMIKARPLWRAANDRFEHSMGGPEAAAFRDTLGDVSQYDIAS